MERDRNLLFGVFAVQLNKVSAIQLMEAAAAWAVEPSKGIPERLVAARALSDGDRDLIQRFVDEAVAAHGGNAEQTLISFGGDAQIHRSYRGSIVLTPDGQVSIPPTDVTPHANAATKSDPDLGSIKGVFETPGRYTNAIEHARGGMGRVLLVHDDYLGRDIALKELLPHLGEVEDATTRDRGAASTEDGPPSPVRFSAHILARFLQEARITGQLEHPSIVPVYELGHRADGSLYYTMKLVRGRSLSKALKECKTLEERLRYLPHFVDLCQAIAYAHSRKIIHRDIKPANVMVGEFGETVVLDWGLAKRRDREDVHQQALAETILAMNLGDEVAAAKTAYGQVLGTPVYMPPEQAKGDLDQVDEQSDVYSLGAVLYEILTGNLPFEGKSTREVLNKVIAGDALPVSAHIENAPPELVAIAAKAMRKEKGQRYSDVKALAEEVQRFQSGALVGAYRYTLRDLLRRYTVKHKALVAATACAAVALLTLFAISYWRIAIERDQAQLARQAEAEALKVSEEKVTELVRASYVSSIRLAESHIDRNEREPARKRLLETPEVFRNWEWGNLYLALDTSTRTLSGNGGAVESASWSPDGRHILTASSDGTAKVWDADTGSELRTLTGHASAVYSASWSPDGHRIVTASWDDTAKVWNADTGTELLTLEGHSESVLHASWSPDERRIVTASSDGMAKVWDADVGAELLTLEGHGSQGVAHAAWSPDGHRIVTASWDGTAKVWDAETGVELSTLRGHGSRGAISAAWYPDGDQSKVGRSPDPHKAVNSASWSPDGCRIVTASRDRTVRVWDAETGVELRTLRGHGSRGVNSAAWSPDGRRILTASWDRTAKVWDAETGVELLTLSGHGNVVRGASWSPDGRRILTASWDGTAKLWRAETEVEPKRLRGHTAMLSDASWSPDGQHILTASADNTVKVWDAVSSAELKTLTGHSEGVESASWSPQGHRIATASMDDTVKVWDVETGLALLTVDSHGKGFSQVSWSPDGRYILTASGDRTARVWDGENGAELLTLEGHRKGVLAASWSPDARRILTASRDRTARVWDAVTGAELRTLEIHDDMVMSVSWSPDSRRILTAGMVPKVWDAQSGTVLRTLTGHGRWTSHASWSPDGRRIATASSDDTVKVWDAETGVELRSLEHGDWASSAAWSPDGGSILTTSVEPAAMVWNSAPWSSDAKHSQEMVDLALREPSIDHKTDLDYRKIDQTLAALEGMVQSWTEVGHAASPSFAEISEVGISVDNPAETQVVEGIALETGDLIVRVNSKRINTMRGAAEIGQSILRRYRESSDSAVTIRFDIVRNYELETYSLLIPGTSKKVFPIKRDQALQLFQAAENLVKRDSAMYATNGEDIVSDRELFLLEMADPLQLESRDRLVSLNNTPINGYPSLSDAIGAVQNALEADTLSEFDLVVYRELNHQRITVRFIVEK